MTRYSFWLALLICLGPGVGIIGIAPTAAVQDYDREARWRAEIEPNVVVGEPVDLEHAGRKVLALYTPAPGSKTAVVIVHGIGVHPDHGIIGTLRMALADQGLTTLSVQMPVLASTAESKAYEGLFADAATRIERAADWLKAKGHSDLVLVSHSLGARMANAYFDSKPKQFRAWVPLGLGAEFTPAFVQRKPVPVLDVYGENDLPQVLSTQALRQKALAQFPKGSQQLKIAGADHFYAGQDKALVEAIVAFVKRP